MDKVVKNQFWKILTAEGEQEATIMLYGFIGEEYEFDEEEQRWKMSGITDLAFVKELSDLAARYPVIHLRINSPGGSAFHGNAIMTAIQSCQAEVHTWNDGMAASMAADIWLCGHRRHMAKNALLMIHAAWDYCIGHAQDMRDCADFLDKVNASAITAVAAATGLSEDEIKSRYYADYKDHWLTYNEAVTDGLVTETGDAYDAADPGAINNMTYKQLLDHFTQKNHPEAPGLMKRIRDAYNSLVRKRGGEKSISTVNTKNTDMTITELKNSLADGSLDLAAVKALLNDLDPAANAEEGEAETPALQAVKVEMDDLKASLAELKDAIKALSAAPGDTKTEPAAPEKDASKINIGGGNGNALEMFNAAAAAAAKDNGTMKFENTGRSRS